MNKTILKINIFVCFLFLSTFSSAQGFVWSEQVELVNMTNVASVGHTSTDVEKDSNGNIYMAGVFSGTQKFGDSTATSQGISVISTDDGFIAKYSANGTFQWLKTFPSTQLAAIIDIDIDANGNIFLLAGFKDNITIDTMLIQSANDNGIVLAKLNSMGELQWAEPIIQANTFNKITGYHLTSNSNDVFISGAFTVSVNISGTTLSSPYPGAAETAFVASFKNQTGVLNWTNITGISALSGLGNIATDNSGNVFLASTATGNYMIGGVNINAASKAVILILKISASGSIDWVKQSDVSGFFSNAVRNININASNGDMILTGVWADTLTFGGMQLIAPSNIALGQKFMWLARFNNTGNAVWMKTNNLPTNDPASTLGLFAEFTSNGDVFLAGEYAGGDMSLGQGSNTVFFASGGSGFISKYTSTGSLSWARVLKCTTVNCWLNIKGMKVVDNNEVVFTGLFMDDFVLDAVSLNAVYPGTVSKPNMYLVKADGSLPISVPSYLIENQTVLTFYPNPANDYLQISIEDKNIKNGQIEIIALTGKQLLNERFEGNDFKVSTAHLPNGIYLLKVSGKHYQSIHKFIIHN